VSLVSRVQSRVQGWRPYPAEIFPDCASCGSTRRAKIARRVSFRMAYTNAICNDCGLVYLCPRPAADSYADFYENLYPELYGKTGAGSEPTRRGMDVLAYLREVVDLPAQRGLFDIGCGDGGLLLAAAEALAEEPGVAIGGCDPGWRGPAAITHEGREIRISSEPVERLADTLGSYSLFLMYDVIEHLLDPVDLLLDLRRLTLDDALLFVSTSCLDNWREMPPGGWETYYLRLAHTFTFTERTLERVLGAGGWRVVQRRPAPKGDQWVVCDRHDSALPLPPPDAAHVDEVLAWIDLYKQRCASA
jgi:hypothetical protein